MPSASCASNYVASSASTGFNFSTAAANSPRLKSNIAASYCSCKVMSCCTLTPPPGRGVSVQHDMTLQEQYDAAMFDFSRGEFAAAVEKLKPVLAEDAT